MPSWDCKARFLESLLRSCRTIRASRELAGRHVFRYTRTVLLSFALFSAGALLVGVLLIEYFVRGHDLPGPASAVDHLAVTGLLFVIMGFSTFCFTLLLHATGVKFGRDAVASDDGG